METNHNTSEQEIVHEFDNGYQLVTNLQTMTANLMSGEEQIDSFSVSHMLVGEYAQRLIAISEIVD